MKRLLLAPLVFFLAAGAQAQVNDYFAFEAAGKPSPAPSGVTPTQPSGSTVTLFTSRADWLAATNVDVLEGFDGGLTPAGGLSACDAPVSAASNDDCFEPGDLVAGFRLELGGGPRGGGEFVVLGDGFLGQPSAVIGPNSFSDLTNIIFTAGNVNAVAFDGYSGADGGGTIEGSSAGFSVRIFDAGDGLIDSFFVGTSAFNEAAFVGILSPVQIGRVEVEGSNGSGELIDGLAFGPAGAAGPIAVPASNGWVTSLLLALMLLGGLVYLGRLGSR